VGGEVVDSDAEGVYTQAVRLKILQWCFLIFSFSENPTMIRKYLLLAAIALAGMLGSNSQAALISGSIGMTIGAGGTISPSSGSLNTAFSITNVTTIPGSGFGDWSAFGSLFVTSSMNFGAFDSTATAFSFTDPNFGTFTGTVIGDTGQVATVIGHSRTIGISGTFTPGTALAPYTGSVISLLQVQLQDIDDLGNDGGRSASVTFFTTGRPVVPEPATSAIACLGLVGLLAAGRRARRNGIKS